MSRYARQEILPEIGPVGQEKLREARVLVVGAGGLAAPVLQYLAGAGLGRLTVMDGDTVSQSNLHRQTLFRGDQVGQSKARVAADFAHALNPDVTVEAVETWFDPTSGADHVARADIVLDCADTYAVSLGLSDLCLACSKPLITASVLAFAGYALGCCGSAPSLRAIFPELPAGGATCATAGVSGPIVGIIGALQAQMALSAVLGLTPSPLGQLVRFDAKTWRSAQFRFDQAPEPARPMRFIGETALRDEDVIIDLRDEMAKPFDQRARHVLPSDIAQLAPAEDRRVVLACRTGLRAHRAGEVLQQQWPGEIALLAVNDPNR
ncbi:MAG: HesA/MoeB/ThiF family protein [Pseudomonadota bacterium]